MEVERKRRKRRKGNQPYCLQLLWHMNLNSFHNNACTLRYFRISRFHYVFYYRVLYISDYFGYMLGNLSSSSINRNI